MDFMFREQYTEQILRENMLGKIDNSYDKSEGTFFYDMLSPVAIELAKLYKYTESILDKGFADTAKDKDLDRIANEVGIVRKQASKATGYVTITGINGSSIIAGEKVASDSINFIFLENKKIENKEVDVLVECEIYGETGNVPAGSIKYFPKTLQGLQTVTNKKTFTNGYDTEDDESLRKRYYLRVRMPSTSGNKSDYESWSRSVIGVSDARCIPRWNGRGTVKVVIVDENHRGANKELVKEVFEYIETQRPVGADVTVVGAREVAVNVNVTIKLNSAYILNDVVNNIKKDINSYLEKNGLRSEYVSISKISQLILNVAGVDDIDYDSLTLNGQSKNIVLEIDQIATIGDINVGV